MHDHFGFTYYNLFTRLKVISILASLVKFNCINKKFQQGQCYYHKNDFSGKICFVS